MLEGISPKSLRVFTSMSWKWFQGDSIQTPPKSHTFSTATLLPHRYLHRNWKKVGNTFSKKVHLYHSQISSFLFFSNYFIIINYLHICGGEKETWFKTPCQVSFHFCILKQILYSLPVSYTYSFSNDWGTGQDSEVLEKSLQLLFV